MIFTDAFKGRSVFVTGHTGFKGSWLCLWLARLGANVTGYALEPPTLPNNFSVSEVRPLLTNHYVGDIRDCETMTKAMQESKPDVVLHLAAETVVRRSYRHPRETFEVNVNGTASVLDAVSQLDRPCAVVAITSDKCYANHNQVWGYRENDPLGELEPYGASKAAAEILINAYRHSYFPPKQVNQHGIKLASARAGNVIGGGDWTEDALIVDLVQALSEGREVDIRNPHALRPWQHVLQALDGYLTLAAKLLESDEPHFCSGWNIGPMPGNELPVQEIVERFQSEWGSGSWRDASDPNQPHEASILRLNIDKAIWQLNWRPRWGIDQTLHYTLDWFRQHFQEQANMQQVCYEQITAYEETEIQQASRSLQAESAAF